MKNAKIIATTLSLCVLFALDASAKPGIFKKFKANYPTATKVAAIGCAICHVEGTEYKVRTAYGQDVDANFVANGSNVNDIKWAEFEGKDSDGDAYTNLEEINAGTNPGDRNDKPTTH